jgi:hypothetical protein
MPPDVSRLKEIKGNVPGMVAGIIRVFEDSELVAFCTTVDFFLSLGLYLRP